MRRLLRAVLLSAVLLAPGAAHAVEVLLDLGVGYWFENAWQFDIHARIDQKLAKYVSVGVRPGVLMNVRPGVEIGLPVDAVVRFHIPHINFDVLGGMAFLFGNPSWVRGHVAAGFSVPIARGFAIGGEAGWLQNAAQLLLRFAFTF